MSNSLEDLMRASNILLEALATVNEAHLAHFTRKTVPELELVKHVRKKLAVKLGSEGRVFKSVKGLHEEYGKVVFLKQPDVDLPFLHRNTLHGVEFKLLRKGISFYSGLEEAIAYSTYGIDYGWIIHFFRKSFKHRKSYERWMRFALEGSGCRSVGYITATTGTPKVVVFPKEQFSLGNDYELAEIVLKIRKKLFSKR
jgi:hypothetical protein